MTLPHEPAARHRAIADRFGELVQGTTDWSRPAPVAGWTALDVVDHLVTWFPAFLTAGSPHRLPAGPAVATDPLAAWRAQAEGVQALLDDPEVAGSAFTHPHIPPQDLASTIASIYTADVFMHSWDLARATGQDDTLDPELCEEMVTGMVGIEEMLRASGQFGTSQPVAQDATSQERLIAFIGRDPRWQRPGI